MWSSRFQYPSKVTAASAVDPAAQPNDKLPEDGILIPVRGKTSGTKERCSETASDLFKKQTTLSISSPDERIRIEVTTQLSGEQRPTASVLLRFCANEPHAVLDFRALWSFSFEVPSDDSTADHGWASYEFYRNLTQQLDVSVKVFYDAMWRVSNTDPSARE